MTDSALLLGSDEYGLLTDLYQLTMTACYVGEGVAQRRSSFELFVRKFPSSSHSETSSSTFPGRFSGRSTSDFGYLIAMGLAQAIEYLEQFRFTPNQIAVLKQMSIFANAPAPFWDLLADARFTGDVWAVAEGTAILPHEPLLRVEAPLWQAQIVESYLLNTINYQTLIATKAARIRDVAGETPKLLEFGTRRAFSPQASLWAARAAIAAGFDATSNVLAAIKLGQQPSGTMAHALVMALSALEGTENEAFTAFHRYFPSAALLIDTYDTIAAAKRLAEQVNLGNLQLQAVRIDSGDLIAQSQAVQQILPGVAIVGSGDLDEWEIARLATAGAKINAYGIGTKLVTGEPINGVYKLVEIDDIPVMKGSSGKVTYPGRKQIFRRYDAQGQMIGDRLGLMTEFPEANEIPLLQCVMQQGERLSPTQDLLAIAQNTRASVTQLPPTARQISQPIPPPLEISTDLQTLTAATQQRIRGLLI